MKTFIIGIVTTALTLPLALGASAQQSTDTPRNRGTETKRERATTNAPKDAIHERQAWTRPEGVMDSKTLIGTRIKNAEGKDVGEIDQLLVNERDGKVSHVVIGMGGLVGVGETKVVVPWSDLKLRHEGDSKKWVATMDQMALERAPKYEARSDRDRAPAASPATAPRRDEPPTRGRTDGK